MRTADECRAKAVALELRAKSCGASEPRADLLHMARCWRDVARQADWQDSPAYAGFGLN
jgi:hypothetical protein